MLMGHMLRITNAHPVRCKHTAHCWYHIVQESAAMPRAKGVGMPKAKKKKIPLPDITIVIAEATATISLPPEPVKVDAITERYSSAVQEKLAVGRRERRRLVRECLNRRSGLEHQFAVHKMHQRLHSVRSKRWEAAENRHEAATSMETA